MSDNTNGYKRIATEEAWAPAEMLDMWRKIIRDKAFDDPGFLNMWGFFLMRDIPMTNDIIDRLQDLGERRLGDMEATGIDMQLLLLTAPGVQVFDPPSANSIAVSSNDQLAEACRKYPDRFAGLAAIAPQDPAAAARELERAVRTLGLKGAVINSHTDGEYLDEQKFWEILEAAESLDVPIYIHPQTPPRDMIRPFLKRHLDMAIMGFAVEVAFHTLAIIVSGAFDRFPGLRIVIGHGGEGLPFWLWRMDHMQKVLLNNRPDTVKLQRKISDYIKENIYITTSGMAWEPVIKFTQDVLGFDRVLYAMDYPYQFDPAEVKVTDDMSIPDADKKKLYQLNAEKVFSLNA